MDLNQEAANEFRVQRLVIWLVNGYLGLLVLGEENILKLYLEEYSLHWKMLCRLVVRYAEKPSIWK